jgi:hypothetical protein
MGRVTLMKSRVSGSPPLSLSCCRVEFLRKYHRRRSPNPSHDSFCFGSSGRQFCQFVWIGGTSSDIISYHNQPRDMNAHVKLCDIHWHIPLQLFCPHGVSWWKYPPKNYISATNCHTRIRFMSSERKTQNFSFHARLRRLRQLRTFGELSNDVDIIRIGSMHVISSRDAIFYGCSASF